MPRLLLGIDIGTTATKGIILEPDSGIIAKAETRSMLRSPHSGWAEEDPRQWWDNVAVVTRKCLGDACARPEEIAAVGVSGMVPTLILLDAEGRVLRASIQQNDARSYREIDDFLQRVSNEELLEGIAYGFLHHLEVMAERGLKASRARVTNGGTRSMLWKQITSDVLGLPLEQVADHPGSSLGAAFVAGKGAGVFKNWSDIERFISVGETVEANLAAHERYQQFFGVYREIYASLKDTFPALLKAVGRN